MGRIFKFTGMAILIIGNICFYFYAKTTTSFFNESHTWHSAGLRAVESSGVLIFNDEENQPDPKKYVQFFKFYCEDKKCSLVEGALSSNRFVFVYSSQDLEVKSISYEGKNAVVVHKDCTFNIGQTQTTFNCSQKGETGHVGSHIKLFRSKYALF